MRFFSSPLGYSTKPPHMPDKISHNAHVARTRQTIFILKHYPKHQQLLLVEICQARRHPQAPRHASLTCMRAHACKANNAHLRNNKATPRKHRVAFLRPINKAWLYVGGLEALPARDQTYSTLNESWVCGSDAKAVTFLWLFQFQYSKRVVGLWKSLPLGCA
jgi:hypothetical protein